MTVHPLPAVLAEPPSALSDFLGAAGNLLHRLLLLPPQASAHARSLDSLHYFEFVVFWAIGFVVIGASAWFVLRYRRRSTDGEAPRTREIRAPAWLELGIAFALLGMFMLWWMIGFSQYRERYDPPDDAVEIYAVGRQWVWKFSYPGGPESVGTLYLPVGRPVRLILTSRDVIHSLFIPAFRIKQDAVPGRYTSIWFEPVETGRYRLMCAEFCGDGHGRMWAEVVVLPADRFDRWLEGYPPDIAEEPSAGEPGVIAPGAAVGPNRLTLPGRGQAIAAEKGCFSCHTTDGSRHLAPTWLGLYGARVPLSGGDTVVADPAYLTESMMDPQRKIVEGFDPIMPSFQGRLTPAQAAALVEYIRSLRSTP